MYLYNINIDENSDTENFKKKQKFNTLVIEETSEKLQETVGLFNTPVRTRKGRNKKKK